MQTAFLLIRCLLCMRSCWIFDSVEIRLTLFVDLNFECLTRVFFLTSKFLEMIKILSYALRQRFLDLCTLYASFLRLEESLSSRSSHRICWLEEALWSWSSHSNFFDLKKSLSSWFSHRIFFATHSQSALKIWENIFLNDSEKAWFDDFTVCCFQYRESDFVQFTVFNLMTDSWLVDSEIWVEFFLILLLSYIRVDELLEKKWFRRERRRIVAIALNTSDFENLFDFSSHIHNTSTLS